MYDPVSPFNGVRFDGTFRSYQQDVLDHANEHLKDGRIHIVAAPGSGKTILGLELIRRLGAPTLILSPSVTIRQQWGERFIEKYASSPELGCEMLSYDVKKPSVLTSITYQALHAAVNKSVVAAENDSDELDAESAQDYSDFNIFAELKRRGVRTICLDEAHHLKKEWQKALEIFLEKMQSSVTIIALTATPPYDSTPAEWNRYITTCGEIDEEIFVPQLVAQKTLCPHQDYIYFSYPTSEETELLRAYREKAFRCTNELLSEGIFAAALEAAGLINCSRQSLADAEKRLFSHYDELSALVVTARQANIPLSASTAALVEKKYGLPAFTIDHAQTAFQFIIDNPDLFSVQTAELLSGELSRAGLIEKRKVYLMSNEKLTKMLIASTGKFDSINSIIGEELSSLGDGLRMLILTDFVKRDLLKTVGTDERLHTMGTVPIFESVRRQYGSRTPIAVLSGPFVAAPAAAAPALIAIAEGMGIAARAKPLPLTEYSEMIFSGSNKNKVAVMTEAFRQGIVRVMIGTKSLLGEGWDSPCINSLILASFVGSFMLSNQMRGRAIRTDRAAPDKASNIWHLVTAEPSLHFDDPRANAMQQASAVDKSKVAGDDFAMLERRFSGFLAPAYGIDIIESGMDRIDILTPPFDENGLKRINAAMLALARDRRAMAHRWQTALNGCENPEILDAVELPAAACPKRLASKHIGGVFVLVILIAALVAAYLYFSAAIRQSVFLTAVLVALSVLFGILLVVRIVKLVNLSSPKKVIKNLAECLYTRLARMKLISVPAKSRSTSVSAPMPVVSVFDSQRKGKLCCVLSGVSVHDKRVFAAAVSELLSSIADPRYLLIRGGENAPDYFMSLACPSSIASKKENVDALAADLRKTVSGIKGVYTRNECGARMLDRCRAGSYLNQNNVTATSKKIALTTKR